MQITSNYSRRSFLTVACATAALVACGLPSVAARQPSLSELQDNIERAPMGEQKADAIKFYNARVREMSDLQYANMGQPITH